ncbi:MAG TPA: VacJ family lipoprotein [Rickettsiales bacterium]|nr:VacJ family lipoprotein [Rickettsiales bacterium]
MNGNENGRNFASKVAIAGLLLLATTVLSACAEKKAGEPLKVDLADNNKAAAQQDREEPTPQDRDALEPLNRGIFKFNEVLDGVLLKPLAHIYLGVMPEYGQKMVRNVLTNLTSPVVFLNSALQGDVNNAERTFGRFVVNSTLGVAGAFDVATEFGIKKERRKDFGQTMGVYGAGTGTYIVLPVLGPSDARDTLGLLVDIASDPFTYILTTNESLARGAVDGLVKRADYLPVTDRVYRDSFDPYATFRSMYLQNRGSFVKNYLGDDAREQK